MGNRLFQEARDFTEQATINKDPQSIETAKNAISSAYANSTDAEKVQLRELQPRRGFRWRKP
jgi:hypothetical protein